MYSSNVSHAHVVFSSCEVSRAKIIDNFCYHADRQSTQQQMYTSKSKAWRLFWRLELRLPLMYWRGWEQEVHVSTSCFHNSFNYRHWSRCILMTMNIHHIHVEIFRYSFPFYPDHFGRYKEMSIFLINFAIPELGSLKVSFFNTVNTVS